MSQPSQNQPSLLAIFFVTSSSRDSNLVFRYPPDPCPSRRLLRPQPHGVHPIANGGGQKELTNAIDDTWADSAWRSAQNMSEKDVADALKKLANEDVGAAGDGVDGDGDGECLWRRIAQRRGYLADEHRRQGHQQKGSLSNPGSGRATPAQGGGSTSHSNASSNLSPGRSNDTHPDTAPGGTYHNVDIHRHAHNSVMHPANVNSISQNAQHTSSYTSSRSGDFEARQPYKSVFGYTSSFLATLLSPKPALCHQKFELIVDELAFIGHPVCIGADGGWGWDEVYAGGSERRKRGGGSPSVVESPADNGGSERRGRTLKSSSPMRGERSVGQPARPEASVDGQRDTSIFHAEPDSVIDLDTVTENAEEAARAADADDENTDNQTPSRSRSSHTSTGTKTPLNKPSRRPSSHLTSFHLVLVLDRPDPVSTTSSDLPKFIDIFYRQIAFKLTAAMHYEQGRVGYIDAEADKLIALRDKCSDAHENYKTFIQKAIEISKLAEAIKMVYEAVIDSSIAHVFVNDIPINIQLPLHHPLLKQRDNQHRNEVDDDEDEWDYEGNGWWVNRHSYGPEEDWERHGASAGGGDRDEISGWDEEMRLGWKMPPLQPWKTLLLLLTDSGSGDLIDFLALPRAKEEECTPAGVETTSTAPGSAGGSTEPTKTPEDMLRKFLSVLAESPTVSLADISLLTDMDLQSEIYPLARLLVYNRKAKVIDVVSPSLKNIYVPPRKLTRPLSSLTESFSRRFPTVSPLPTLLSALSSSPRPFSSIIPTRDHRPLFLEVLIWLLKRDLLVMMHVRVRLFVPREIKKLVREKRRREWKEAMARSEDRKRVLAEQKKDKESKRREMALKRLSERRSDAGLVGDTRWIGHLETTPEKVKAYSQGQSKVQSRGSRESSNSTRERKPSGGLAGKGGSLKMKKRGRLSLDNITRSYDSRGHNVRAGRNREHDRERDREVDGYKSDDESDGDAFRYGFGYGDEYGDEGEDGEENEMKGFEVEEWGEEDEDLTPSFISEPGRATMLERRWMEAMMMQIAGSAGVNTPLSGSSSVKMNEQAVIANGWFQQISPYFDGKTTMEEIRYRTDISRHDLRNVLHRFDAFLMIFLHP